MPDYDLRINGAVHRVANSDPDQPLLYALRELGFTAAKYGCGLGQCGACSVLIDGRAVRSCIATLDQIGARAITTLEGLGTAEKPHPIQAAFIDAQASQCGYCTSGMIVSAAALLAARPKPSEADVRQALDGNLCRCGTHPRVIRAVMAASGQGG